MRLWRRRLPRGIRRSLPLNRGERILASGVTTDGAYVAATTHALHLDLERYSYDKILKAVWNDEEAVLEIWEPSLAEGRTEIALAEPGHLPETVRERIQSTILASQHVALRGGRGVLISARRPLDGSDVRWTMLFDNGVDSRDPGVRAAANAALDDLRERTGI
jgi:hypothetical protein